MSHSSALKRAVHTAAIVLDGLGLGGIPQHQSWRLNERSYGSWQGRSKAQVREELGAEVYDKWRRWCDAAPPSAESLADVFTRLRPYWTDYVTPDLKRGRTVLVTAHSNSLRALIKHLDQLDKTEFQSLNVPTGIPLVYQLDRDLRPLSRGGTFLSANARDASAAVAAEGQVGPDDAGQP